MKSLGDILNRKENTGTLLSPLYTKERSIRIVATDILPSKSGAHPTIKVNINLRNGLVS